MSGERTEGALPSRLRWYVGVPLGTNPLILLDLSILLTIGWSVSWLSLLALQAGFGGYVDASHVKGAALVSGYLVLAFLGLFGVVCFVVMRNRYAALYRFDEEDAFCDNMRCSPRAADGRRLHFTGSPIDPHGAPRPVGGRGGGAAHGRDAGPPAEGPPGRVDAGLLPGRRHLRPGAALRGGAPKEDRCQFALKKRSGLLTPL